MEQESKYFLVREFSRNFRFPHWSLRWAFWLTVVIIPPFLVFSVATRFVYPKTTFWLCIYLLSITGFAGMAAVVNSVLYNREVGFVDKNEPYHQRYYTAIGVMVPFGAFFLYFTYYLCMIPFTYQPNYVFTVKPSKQLEMELNDLLGADTLEYTPFDYSLDKQEVTYVTDGVDVEKSGIIWRFLTKPDKTVVLASEDAGFLYSIVKIAPFRLEIRGNACYLVGEVEIAEARKVYHQVFKTPITLKRVSPDVLLVGTAGVYRLLNNECVDSFPSDSLDFNPMKRYAIQAYIQYSSIFRGVFDYQKTQRREYDFTLERFDSRISDF